MALGASTGASQEAEKEESRGQSFHFGFHEKLQARWAGKLREFQQVLVCRGGNLVTGPGVF